MSRADRDGHRIIVAGLHALTQRRQGKWSIQEHVGHLHDLETLHLFLDRFERGQQRRNRDERAQMRGYSVAQLQGWQQRRAKAPRHTAVHDSDRCIDRRDRSQNAE